MSDLDRLSHVRRSTPTGATVIVLDTGALIDAEAGAMLQALHSRSVGGLDAHLLILAQRGAQRFMETFYVGYGHKSIGDCGTTTIFIEGVSMPVAKAIQDSPLYSGQEASTRYIDFATQEFKNPSGSEAGRIILEAWRNFYVTSLPVIVSHLKTKYPRQEHEDEKVYDKAIRARAFDILRGFLPAGASTNLAWHTNLRQAHDHLLRLRHHPLEEVRLVAESIEDALRERHPNSFNHRRHAETEEFVEQWMAGGYYYTGQMNHPDFMCTSRHLDQDRVLQHSALLEARPAKTEIPRELRECGTLEFNFLLDYASWRDIQRHRAVQQRMPLLSFRHRFESWYLDELSPNLRKEAERLLNQQEIAIAGLGIDKVLQQYYLPMGQQVACTLTGDLPALVYLIELRTTRFVHPTLRRRALQMAEVLTRNLESSGLRLHLDIDPDRFDVRRGEHDIVVKE